MNHDPPQASYHFLWTPMGHDWIVSWELPERSGSRIADDGLPEELLGRPAAICLEQHFEGHRGVHKKQADVRECVLFFFFFFFFFF